MELNWKFKEEKIICMRLIYYIYNSGLAFYLKLEVGVLKPLIG